jgi:hypothetical protein
VSCADYSTSVVRGNERPILTGSPLLAHIDVHVISAAIESPDE